MIISIGDSLFYSVLGMLIVFLGLVLLMWVIQLMAKIFEMKNKTAASPLNPAPAVSAATDNLVSAAPAPDFSSGTAGSVARYDVDDKTAALLMAIVANKSGKPLNEIRFVSIRRA